MVVNSSMVYRVSASIQTDKEHQPCIECTAMQTHDSWGFFVDIHRNFDGYWGKLLIFSRIIFDGYWGKLLIFSRIMPFSWLSQTDSIFWLELGRVWLEWGQEDWKPGPQAWPESANILSVISNYSPRNIRNNDYCKLFYFYCWCCVATTAITVNL